MKSKLTKSSINTHSLKSKTILLTDWEENKLQIFVIHLVPQLKLQTKCLHLHWFTRFTKVQPFINFTNFINRETPITAKNSHLFSNNNFYFQLSVIDSEVQTPSPNKLTAHTYEYYKELSCRFRHQFLIFFYVRRHHSMAHKTRCRMRP